MGDLADTWPSLFHLVRVSESCFPPAFRGFPLPCVETLSPLRVPPPRALASCPDFTWNLLPPGPGGGSGAAQPTGSGVRACGLGRPPSLRLMGRVGCLQRIKSFSSQSRLVLQPQQAGAWPELSLPPPAPPPPGCCWGRAHSVLRVSEQPQGLEGAQETMAERRDLWTPRPALHRARYPLGCICDPDNPRPPGAFQRPREMEPQRPPAPRATYFSIPVASASRCSSEQAGAGLRPREPTRR